MACSGFTCISLVKCWLPCFALRRAICWKCAEGVWVVLGHFWTWKRGGRALRSWTRRALSAPGAGSVGPHHFCLVLPQKAPVTVSGRQAHPHSPQILADLTPIILPYLLHLPSKRNRSQLEHCGAGSPARGQRWISPSFPLWANLFATRGAVLVWQLLWLQRVRLPLPPVKSSFFWSARSIWIFSLFLKVS